MALRVNPGGKGRLIVGRTMAAAMGLKKVNPKSDLTWELPIKARDKINIDYSYKVYVRD